MKIPYPLMYLKPEKGTPVVRIEEANIGSALQSGIAGLYPSRRNVFMGYTAISRKVVGKMCTRQSRKVIWDIINSPFLTTVAVEPTFVAFLYHSQTHFHGLSRQFFQISLKNRELKTTQNAFRDCRVHFSQQSFSN